MILLGLTFVAIAIAWNQWLIRKSNGLVFKRDVLLLVVPPALSLAVVASGLVQKSLTNIFEPIAVGGLAVLFYLILTTRTLLKRHRSEFAFRLMLGMLSMVAVLAGLLVPALPE